MLRFSSLAIIAVLVLLAASAEAGKLSGKLSLGPRFVEQAEAMLDSSESKEYRGYWNEPNAVQQVLPLKIDLSSDFGVVLFKEGAPEPKADIIKTIKVFTGSLEKNVVVIRPQSRIKFHSVDPLDHDLYSPGKHDFKPQQIAQNSVRPVDFYSAGLFEVKCTLFPHFSAWVVVVPATYVLEPKSDGTFSLDAIESGNYTLKVFYKGKWILEKKFTVADEKEFQLDVTLESPAESTGSAPSTPAEKPADAEKAKKDN